MSIIDNGEERSVNLDGCEPTGGGGGGGGGKKAPPPCTSFSPVTSANVGFGPQNFLAFSFNPFATLVQSFKFVRSASPKLLNLNQDHP